KQDRFVLMRCSDHSQTINPACPYPRKNLQNAGVPIIIFEGFPLRSCRRRSHRREPSPVVWKVRKVQRKGFLSMWPRCPCSPAIDRRQFFGGGQLRKLRNILRSPKRVWVPCQIVRCLMERLGSLHLQ